MIHYQNPKPTATLVCPKNQSILLVKRAFDPGKGLWGLPGGFIELNETPEIAAIQTFPDDYIFKGSRRSIQKQIGNAVPPQLAKAIGEHILKELI